MRLVNRLTGVSKKRWGFIGGGALLIIFMVIGFVIITRQNETNNPDVGGAQATADLVKTVSNMQKSFNSLSMSTDDAARYVGYMNDLQQNCKDIYAYKDLASSQHNAESLARLSVSATLCDDLTRLATNSKIIYSATLPLLSTNPHAKRYQSIPPIRDATRNRQLKQVSVSITTLTKPVNRIEYPTQVIELLKQLQSSMKSSKGLAYYPALLNFQQKLLAERQLYWIDYADIGGLNQSLNNQLQTYCTNLKSDNVSVPVCKDAKS